MTIATRVPGPLASPALTSFADRVLATIRRHGLLRGGEIVLAAVSGGADSVALLDALCALRSRLRLTVHAAHVHHGLRARADQDARFAEDCCARLHVPFHLERVSVRTGPPWDGPEAEARRARYAALARLARAIGAERVATGHTADDQAETVLMRLLQGAGPRGLAGIRPLREPYIRPLIETRRAEIEAHLGESGLSWVDDETNRDRRFLRNRIRHEVVPLLREIRGPGIVDSLCRSAALLRELVADLERRASLELSRLGRVSAGGLTLDVAGLQSLPGELAAEVLRLAVDRAGGAGSLRRPAHRELRRVLESRATCRGTRLGRVTVERSGRWLRVGAHDLPRLLTRSWPVPGELALPELGIRLDARHVERPAEYAPPRHPGAVAFDADLVGRTLTVRARCPGDRFHPFGAPGPRRLKSVLVAAGVPRWERERIPLLESQGEILWVAGVRRGSAAPVLPGSRCILEVTLCSPLAVVSGAE